LLPNHRRLSEWNYPCLKALCHQLLNKGSLPKLLYECLEKLKNLGVGHGSAEKTLDGGKIERGGTPQRKPRKKNKNKKPFFFLPNMARTMNLSRSEI